VRSALITGVVVAAVVAIIGWGRTLSNADFIYMCCAARLLGDGGLPASAYFPPGYPALLLLAVQTGLSALSAGALLSALGTGLSASAIVWTARRLRLPVALAVALGLLGAALPDVFEIAFNPHLDALYTGLALWLIALALALLDRTDAPPWMVAVVAILAALLMLLRYHAVLVAVPIGLALLLAGRRIGWRRGLAVLLAAVCAGALAYALLYAASGSTDTAAWTQVATGTEYRLHGPRATEIVFEDYAGWLAAHPPAGWTDAWANVAANWPRFMARKAILIGLAVWLLALVVRRRLPQHSHWLVLLILGYTLAVAPTYFTPRASALPELAAVLLLSLSLAALLGTCQDASGESADAPEEQPEPAGWIGLARPLVIAVLLLAATAWNVWRELPVLAQWHGRHGDLLEANRAALELAGGRREQLLGTIDFTGWPQGGRYSLPGAAYSRGWLDDPAVAAIAGPAIPRYDAEQVLRGTAPVRVLLLWEHHRGVPGHAQELRLIERLERSWVWREKPSPVDGARLWVRSP